MRLTTPLALLLALCLLAGWPFASPAAGVEEINLHQTLRVVMDDNYPPYVFRDPKTGGLQGILIDQWRLWEAKTGVRAHLTGMDWGKAQRRMLAGEFQVIDTIFRTPSREALYDFSRPYARIEVPVFFSAGISGIRGVADLSGFVVAAKAGDSVVEFLRQHGISRIETYPSYERLLAAARDGKVKVFTVDKPPALYLLNRMGLLDRFRQGPDLYQGEFHRAVRKGDTALLGLVEDGFAKISKQEYQAIDRRWLGSPLIAAARPYRRYALHLLAGATALVATLGLWLWLTRRMVASRTRDLRREIAQREKTEAWLQSLVRAIPDLVWFKDLEGAYLFCNPRAEAWLGRPEAEIIGLNDHQLMDQGLAQIFRQSDQAALLSGGPVASERELAFADGHRERLAIVKTPVRDRDGRPTGVLGIARDITAMRQAQERMREREELFSNIVEQAMDAIVLIDGESGTFLEFNQAAHQNLGYSREEFAGLKIADIEAQQTPEEIARNMALLRQLPGMSFDTQHRRRDGSLREVWVSARQIVTAGRPALAAVWRDTTERRRQEAELDRYRASLETQVRERTSELESAQQALLNLLDDTRAAKNSLEQANLRLQELDRLKSLFIASMSHELRTPMNAIIGYASILEQGWDGPLSDRQRQGVERVLRAGRHLLGLINDIIDLGKIEAGVFEAARDEFDSQAMGREAVEMVTGEAQAKGLALRVALCAAPLRTDRKRLTQALINLLGNAIKFTAQGEVRLTMERRAREALDGDLARRLARSPHQEFLWVEVADTGIGMREEELPRLFKPFCRLHETGRSVYPGAGLGLYLTGRLIREALGGEIVARSEAGKGSVFTLAVPTQLT